MSDHLARDGFAIIPNVIDREERENLIALLGPVVGAGRRGLLQTSEVATLAASAKFLDLIRPYLPAAPRAVRAIYFNKSSDANWLVPWHQDLTLALKSRAEVPEFGPWSVKEDVPHVQPPIALLEQMLTIRLHLDDADVSNGALKVLPKSHCLGRLSAERIQSLQQTEAEHLCEAKAGDVLLMRPLLLHASGRSTSDRNRRVLHIEYAAFELPIGLEWHETSTFAAFHKKDR